MGFFAEFNAWLTGLLAGYITNNTARIAGTLEPAIVTLGIVYVMVWGYLQLTGQVEEPFIHGVKRIATLAVILGCALHLWLYNSLIVDTFFNAPGELGAAIVGAFDPVSIVDQIIFEGSDAANLLLAKGSLLNSNFAYYLAEVSPDWRFADRTGGRQEMSEKFLTLRGGASVYNGPNRPTSQQLERIHLRY